MKHWVFDLDGTLVDSFQHFFDTVDAIFKDHGKPFTPDLHHPALTERLDLFFEKHLGPHSLPAALDKLQSMSNESAAHIKPFQGTLDMIADLKKKGAKVGIWTNRDLISATLIVQQTQLHQHIDHLVSGTCTSERKPNPEGLKRMIEAFGCEPHEITMVGDHEYDVRAGKMLGTRSVRAGWHSYWEIPRCADADEHFNSMKDFHHFTRS